MYIYIYIRENHPWTSDTFKKTLLLKVALPYWCFSHRSIYFFFFILLYSFIINNPKQTCLFFNFHDLLQIAQSIICQIIGQNNAHWQYQWWLLNWFPVRFCLLLRNYAYETKIILHLIDISSKPYSTYF